MLESTNTHTCSNSDHCSCRRVCCGTASPPSNNVDDTAERQQQSSDASASISDASSETLHSQSDASVTNMVSPKKMTQSAALIAQKLNNKGVRLMYEGQYNQAISYFLNAMEIGKQLDEKSQEVCTCQCCSLAACVQYSIWKASKIAPSPVPNYGDGFLHSHGISVRPESRGHFMGSVLQLITILNLALSKHLLWVQCGDQSNRQTLQKVANLYQLAFRWYMAEVSDIANFGFVLIILNNLCEIHRQASNRVKLESCTRHLQSALMTVLTSEKRSVCQRMKLDGFCRNAFSATTCAAMA